MLLRGKGVEWLAVVRSQLRMLPPAPVLSMPGSLTVSAKVVPFLVGWLLVGIGSGPALVGGRVRANHGI